MIVIIVIIVIIIIIITIISVYSSQISGSFPVERERKAINCRSGNKENDDNHNSSGDTHCIAVILNKNKNNPFLFIFKKINTKRNPFAFFYETQIYAAIFR